MSNRPDELAERAGDVELWAALVEAHLDRHPLPVDEDAIERAAGRLEASFARRRDGRPLWLAAGLLAAAVFWLAVRVRLAAPPWTVDADAEAPAVMVSSLRTAESRRVDLEEPGRTLSVPPGTTLHAAEVDHTAVILVGEGTVLLDGTTHPWGTWLVLGRRADGGEVTVVFADGEAPPPLDPDTWPQPAVDAALQEVRWRSLPPRTTGALRRLLEE